MQTEMLTVAYHYVRKLGKFVFISESNVNQAQLTADHKASHISRFMHPLSNVILGVVVKLH